MNTPRASNLFGGTAAPFGILAVAATLAFAAAGFAVERAPVERTLHIAQKIFYIHLPFAWCSFAAFFVVFAASAVFLWTRRDFFDALAASAAEVGVAFTTAVLVTGSIWARAAWGVWWTWDVRLTTMLLLWFVYVGYLLGRSALRESGRMSVLAAIYGVVAFVNVPVVHVSVRLFETQHPSVLKQSGGGGLAPGMGRALAVSSAAFAAFFALLLMIRLRQETLARRLDALPVTEER